MPVSIAKRECASDDELQDVPGHNEHSTPTSSLTEQVELSRFPSFTRVVYSDTEPKQLMSINGWAVCSTGDDIDDEVLGTFYAEEAVKWAKTQGQGDPDALLFIMSSIHQKAWSGQIKMGQMERAFIRRIARFAYCGAQN